VSEGHDLSLTREQIIGFLAELGQELDARGVKAQMFVVGGAAMALAYNMRRTTADVDGVFEPKTVIYEAARRVASRHARVVLDLPGVTVSVPAPHYLLALKVQAARIDRDQDDIRFLAREAGAKTADDVLRIAAQVIGSSRLLPKAQFIVQEMFPENPAESPPS
jgi:Nucleotidyltransferase of unknown function (DUF6036)